MASAKRLRQDSQQCSFVALADACANYNAGVHGVFLSVVPRNEHVAVVVNPHHHNENWYATDAEFNALLEIFGVAVLFVCRGVRLIDGLPPCVTTLSFASGLRDFVIPNHVQRLELLLVDDWPGAESTTLSALFKDGVVPAMLQYLRLVLSSSEERRSQAVSDAVVSAIKSSQLPLTIELWFGGSFAYKTAHNVSATYTFSYAEMVVQPVTQELQRV